LEESAHIHEKKGFSGIIKAAYLADLVLASFIFITAILVSGCIVGALSRFGLYILTSAV
jgi:hypothetical protein